jgi:hypothetical protein
MTDDDRPHGSAVGIPEPPPRGQFYRPPQTVARAGRARRRWAPWLVLPLIVVVFVGYRVANPSSPSEGVTDTKKLKVGDCLNVPLSDIIAMSSVTVVDCAQLHNNQVYAIGTAGSGFSAAAASGNNPTIVRICRTEVRPDILAALANTSGVVPGVLVSKSRPDRVVCTAKTTSRTGSLLPAADPSTTTS